MSELKARIPFLSKQSVLDAAEALSNRIVLMDAATLKGLQKLEGKVIAVELMHPTAAFAIKPGRDGLEFLPDWTGTADVLLKGEARSFARLVMSRKGGDEFNSIDMEVRGDVGLAQHFVVIAKGLEIDWQSELQDLVGDKAAVRLGEMFGDITKLAAAGREKLRRDLKELLVHRLALLATRSQFAAFKRDLSQLRGDVSELQSRIKGMRGL